MEDKYTCKNCKTDWGFSPEDYESKEDHPINCPLCSMPFWQLIRDTWQAGGAREVAYWLYRRYLNL